MSAARAAIEDPATDVFVSLANRLVVAQALAEGMPLVTQELGAVAPYGVPVLW